MPETPVRARARRIGLLGLLGASVGGCVSPPTPLPPPRSAPTLSVRELPNPARQPPAGEFRPVSWSVADAESDLSGSQPVFFLPPDDDAGGAPDELPAALPEPEPPRTAVRELVERAIARSPEVRAARRVAYAAAEVAPQVTAYDDPRFQSVYAPLHNHSLQTAGGRVPVTMQVTQAVPWQAKLDHRGAAACDEARRLHALVGEAELKVAERVRRAAADFWFAGEAVRIADESRGFLGTLEEVAKARVRTGASQQDVLSARLERDRLDARVVELEQARAAAAARLASLLGLPVEDARALTVEPPTGVAGGEVETLVSQAVACRPELKALLFAVDRDRHYREVACLQSRPDFTLGVGWQPVDDDDAISPVANGNDNLNLIFGVTIPIWRDKIAAGVREADQRLLAGSRQYDAAIDEIRGDVGEAALRLQLLAERLSLYEDRLLPRSEQTLEVSLADYRGGKTSFVQVTENFLSVLTLETEAARLRADIGDASARLERAVGCPLPERTDVPRDRRSPELPEIPES